MAGGPVVSTWPAMAFRNPSPDAPYRHDIDGLRAIAVVAVVLYHFGHLPAGYLGVDIFFVISGFLITSLVLRQVDEGSFGWREFYLRRIRRILPLSLLVAAVVLPLGMATMLPDDLENLAASVVATNLCANNLLQAATTRNYWDVANEYKPLMHTWSLGVEEQYYLLYPGLLVWTARRGRRVILAMLTVVTVASLLLFIGPFSASSKFYFLPFRFFELSLGGLVAASGIAHWNRWQAAAPFFIVGLFVLLVVGTSLLPPSVLLLSIVLFTAGVLGSRNEQSRFCALILTNPPARFLGLISYSIYMWHQPVLAFARYALFPELHAAHFVGIAGVVFGLSVVTYRCVETPFRNPKVIGTNSLAITLGAVFCVSTAVASYVYARAGVIRDVPELDIRPDANPVVRHSEYNARILAFDRPFTQPGKTRVLVVGNSFARDWANVLLESKHAERIDLSYVRDPWRDPQFHGRAALAEVVFVVTQARSDVERMGIDVAKCFAIGPKYFGKSSGPFYNGSGERHLEQRVGVDSRTVATDKRLAADWGDRYLSYLGQTLDQAETVPVFTPDGKFISQDGRHLTRAGARHFAVVFAEDLEAVLSSAAR